MNTFSLRMRSSASGAHISGAERLVSAADVPRLAQEMCLRALSHEKGTPDSIRLSVDAIPTSDISTVNALNPVQHSCDTVDEARALIRSLLHDAGVECADTVVSMAYSLTGLRGAALVDARTGQRLDTNAQRGVRASTFDACNASVAPAEKHHFFEALVLASKVHSAPGVIAEVCLSDDPHYTKGYVACGGVFHRIPNIKEAGSPLGTRIFVLAPDADVEACIEYLENTPILVDLAPCAELFRPPVSSRPSLSSVCASRNHQWQSQGLARQLKTFSTAQLPRSVVDGTEYLLFASSDYLGLSTHPRLIEASQRAASKFGTGSGGSRLTTGTSLHSDLEAQLAEFFGFEDAVFFATGYQANHSTIAALATPDVEIFSDSLNHASIIDGCRAAKAPVTVFPHADYESLDRLLSASTAAHALVISDAVFSMSGSVIDLPALRRVCHKHGAWLMLDDAHGVGVTGPQGRGTYAHYAHCPLPASAPESSPGPTELAPDIVVGTASKALGAEGGFVLCSKEVATLLRNRARSYVYSTSSAPSTIAAIAESLRVMQEEDVVKQLQDRILLLRNALGEAANIGGPAHSAIIPLEIGEEAYAVEVSQKLRREGIYIPAIRYPTVARGEAMLRLTITARHTAEDIATLTDAVRRLGIV